MPIKIHLSSPFLDEPIGPNQELNFSARHLMSVDDSSEGDEDTSPVPIVCYTSIFTKNQLKQVSKKYGKMLETAYLLKDLLF